MCAMYDEYVGTTLRTRLFVARLKSMVSWSRCTVSSFSLSRSLERSNDRTEGVVTTDVRLATNNDANEGDKHGVKDVTNGESNPQQGPRKKGDLPPQPFRGWAAFHAASIVTTHMFFAVHTVTCTVTTEPYDDSGACTNNVRRHVAYADRPCFHTGCRVAHKRGRNGKDGVCLSLSLSLS